METAVFQDASRSVEEPVADLLGRMTLDEKLAQLGSAWGTSPAWPGPAA